jgi:hypothetical protein
MNVTVTITGTSPNYTITPSPAGPYIGSVAVTFQNNSTAGITVYYRVAGTSAIRNQNVAQNNPSSVVNSAVGDLEYNVVLQGAANPGTWAHVIHVGSGG